MPSDENQPVEGSVDERGIFISAEGKARARARRLEAQARMSTEKMEAIRSRLGLRPGPHE